MTGGHVPREALIFRISTCLARHGTGEAAKAHRSSLLHRRAGWDARDRQLGIPAVVDRYTCYGR